MSASFTETRLTQSRHQTKGIRLSLTPIEWAQELSAGLQEAYIKEGRWQGSRRGTVFRENRVGPWWRSFFNRASLVVYVFLLHTQHGLHHKLYFSAEMVDFSEARGKIAWKGYWYNSIQGNRILLYIPGEPLFRNANVYPKPTRGRNLDSRIEQWAEKLTKLKHETARPENAMARWSCAL